MTTTRPPLHLAACLDGAGGHPAAWREPDADPAGLYSAAYWAGLAEVAEGGLLDFVTIEDSFTVQSSRADGPDGRTDRVRGRLDAALVAARIAPLSKRIGLVPTVTTAHTEPFHVSKAIATLDYVSAGRAGWQVQPGGLGGEAALFGRRDIPGVDPHGTAGPQSRAVITGLFDEARDHVDVVRRLWDSWEDGAEIRDAPSGRFVDRKKLHHIDFEGAHFSVRGPSITPRPPQGQPVVATLARHPIAYDFAGRAADVVFVTPDDPEQAAAMLAEIRTAQEDAGRADATVHVFADLVVFLDDDPGAAGDRKKRLDETAGSAYVPDAPVFIGTPCDLVEQLLAWQEAGLSGFRLRPGALPHDLTAVTRGLVPELQARGAFRRGYSGGGLRGRLGLGRATNRFAVDRFGADPAQPRSTKRRETDAP